MRNVEYLKDKPIAVLGGGAVAKAQAADCALTGARVRICDIEPFATDRACYYGYPYFPR